MAVGDTPGSQSGSHIERTPPTPAERQRTVLLTSGRLRTRPASWQARGRGFESRQLHLARSNLILLQLTDPDLELGLRSGSTSAKFPASRPHSNDGHPRLTLPRLQDPSIIDGYPHTIHRHPSPTRGRVALVAADSQCVSTMNEFCNDVGMARVVGELASSCEPSEGFEVVAGPLPSVDDHVAFPQRNRVRCNDGDRMIG